MLLKNSKAIGKRSIKTNLSTLKTLRMDVVKKSIQETYLDEISLEFYARE